jgi:hypothetical protein
MCPLRNLGGVEEGRIDEAGGELGESEMRGNGRGELSACFVVGIYTRPGVQPKTTILLGKFIHGILILVIYSLSKVVLYISHNHNLISCTLARPVNQLSSPLPAAVRMA